jgi:hypothetical protein
MSKYLFLIAFYEYFLACGYKPEDLDGLRARIRQAGEKVLDTEARK